jgi:orotidine-5'-phosphate decarboxylase
MDYIEKLKISADKVGHVACLGLDPAIKWLPKGYSVKGIKGFPEFLDAVYREMIERGLSPAAVKPNDAFYSCHNTPMLRESQRWDGYNALSDVISITHEFFPDVPVILDVKREDIGSTAEMYAKTCCTWDVEAVTIGPYLGRDSMGEFLKKKQLGAYALVRTSNKSAEDFQSLPVKVYLGDPYEHATQPLYMAVLDHLLYEEYANGIGAVIGATSLREFEICLRAIGLSRREVPLLIPGVGTQGGSAPEIMEALRVTNYNLSLARINSSSGITHPWKSNPIWKDGGAPPDAVKLAVDAFEKLAEECAL